MKQQLAQLESEFITTARPVHTEKWQGVDIKDRPEAEMMEQLFVHFRAPVPADLPTLREEVKPNLPWADRHFELERVSGEPVNPGDTWREWPWANSADGHRTEGEQFNHSYSERFWPKHAGMTPGGRLTDEPSPTLKGIRYDYGDLGDVVELLRREINTRQAFLPVYFPEDTGSVHGSRVPCSIGYHFFHRNGFMHIGYWLRSCDIYRHMRDDVYLTSRLLLWVIDKLKADHPAIKPGWLDMNITSLHCFINDFRVMKEKN